jgi:acyl phosphate:glycerol-3-phosphate acyltransferase
MITATIFIVIAYVVGSLSSAIIVCKIMHLPDPRSQGSNNPGATNVLRIGGKLPAVITLVGDMLKGAIPVLLAHLFNVQGFALGLVAIAALIGHIFPVFFKFQGGKGVATALGAMFALSPLLGIAMIITWLIVAALFRYSSLAALVSAGLAPIYAAVFTNYGYLLPILGITAILVWRHWTNIERLKAGTETKIQM